MTGQQIEMLKRLLPVEYEHVGEIVLPRQDNPGLGEAFPLFRAKINPTPEVVDAIVNFIDNLLNEARRAADHPPAPPAG